MNNKSIDTRQSFTPLGFSKKGFSCCSNWHECDNGKKECAISNIDNEAALYCNCYQRHHKICLEIESSKFEDLFSLIDENDIDEIFQSFENHRNQQKKQMEVQSIMDESKEVRKNFLKQLSTMSDHQVLETDFKLFQKNDK